MRRRQKRQAEGNTSHSPLCLGGRIYTDPLGGPPPLHIAAVPLASCKAAGLRVFVVWTIQSIERRGAASPRLNRQEGLTLGATYVLLSGSSPLNTHRVPRGSKPQIKQIPFKSGPAAATRGVRRGERGDFTGGHGVLDGLESWI